jgi:hypothetical protein
MTRLFQPTTFLSASCQPSNSPKQDHKYLASSNYSVWPGNLTRWRLCSSSLCSLRSKSLPTTRNILPHRSPDPALSHALLFRSVLLRIDQLLRRQNGEAVFFWFVSKQCVRFWCAGIWSVLFNVLDGSRWVVEEWICARRLRIWVRALIT